ncbi:hypothetical protein [Lonsdalea quercina]|uniref:hypothetical protein n=1 Tax=Lonsdalea quercina TaxID=71657 RepID=UPI003974A58F
MAKNNALYCESAIRLNHSLVYTLRQSPNEYSGSLPDEKEAVKKEIYSSIVTQALRH